jgi:hypothetical protein
MNLFSNFNIIVNLYNIYLYIILNFKKNYFNINVLLFFFKFKLIYNILNFNKNINSINNILILTFKNLHLKINFYNKNNYINLYLSIGIILNILKLKTKFLKRNFKGIKMLINFFLKKNFKFLIKKNTFFKFLGLNKKFLKLFFLLNNIYSSSNIKIFLFSPLKS